MGYMNSLSDQSSLMDHGFAKEPNFLFWKKYGIDSIARFHDKDHSLEVKLFKEYLSGVPKWLVENKMTWASIIIGFEEYVPENAIKHAGLGFSKVQNSAYGAATVTGPFGAVKNTVLTGKVIRESATTYMQAVNLLENKPQIFNRTWYEKSFGPPPIPWGDVKKWDTSPPPEIKK